MARPASSSECLDDLSDSRAGRAFHCCVTAKRIVPMQMPLAEIRDIGGASGSHERLPGTQREARNPNV